MPILSQSLGYPMVSFKSFIALLHKPSLVWLRWQIVAPETGTDMAPVCAPLRKLLNVKTSLLRRSLRGNDDRVAV